MNYARSQLVTVEEAAELMCVSPSTIRRMIAGGLLSSVKIGACRRVPRAALDAVITGRPQPVVAPDHWPTTEPLW